MTESIIISYRSIGFTTHLGSGAVRSMAPHSFLFAAKTAKREGARDPHLISFANDYRCLSKAHRVTSTGEHGCLKTA